MINDNKLNNNNIYYESGSNLDIYSLVLSFKFDGNVILNKITIFPFDLFFVMGRPFPANILLVSGVITPCINNC